MADFVAIDVETANADMASICQIGLVRYVGGKEVEAARWFVDPDDDFDDFNIRIHGIEPHHVAGAPRFEVISSAMSPWLRGVPVVCHTHFDRVAILQSHGRYRLPPPDCTWLDSAKVARRAWPDVAKSGYGLANMAYRLGIEFRHHDALEDARACAKILMHAISETGFDLAEWQRLVRRPVGGAYGQGVKRDGDGDGPLVGECITFTGELLIARREAADRAHLLGAAVEAGVTKKTTILVVGDQDLSKRAGHVKSSKHRKAEALIDAGAPIRIIRETDFMAFRED